MDAKFPEKKLFPGSSPGTWKLSPINIPYEMKSKPILNSREHQPFHGNG